MKLSKTFLTGILALTLVFGMTLTGCDNGSSDDGSGGGGGGGDNSLTGSWVDNRATPTRAFIFTDEADTAIAGAKVAYYSTNLTAGGTAGNDVTIGGTAYTLTLAGNTLTLTGYDTTVQGNPVDVIFDRVKGTSGSTIHGIWCSRLASSHQKYTLLIIRSGNANVFTAVGSNNWGQSAYTLSSDANNTYIKWGNGNPVVYTKTTDPTGLDITPPVGQQITGLMTQPSW
ncbi:MAG: hypothetical protein LBF75_03365 [Treponema sp.]|nr:hypothetical protein [Treponema sp.]